ncbi:Abscisic acid receptor PYL3 [Linum perenne]
MRSSGPFPIGGAPSAHGGAFWTLPPLTLSPPIIPTTSLPPHPSSVIHTPPSLHLPPSPMVTDDDCFVVPSGNAFSRIEDDYIRRHHRHQVQDHQCSSSLVKHIKAPLHLVWSLVRRFDQPQKYKPFVSRCIVQGDLGIGSVREVNVKSGLPATTSTERLEQLDDEEHIFSMRIVGGDHRLKNYSSTVSVHPEVIDGRPGTMVIESFVVDIPEGNTKDETCYFIEALIKCNLKSLAEVSERLAVQDQTEPIDRI